MSKSVYIFHAAGHVDDLPKMGDEALAVMMYFSQDYARSLYWKKKCKNARFLDLGPLLQKTAVVLKPALSALMLELGRQYDSPGWWASRVSERNSGVSSLFLYCCYLKVLEEQLASTDGPLMIIGEDWSFLKAAADLAKAKGFSVVIGHRPLFLEITLKRWVKALGRIIKFLLRSLVAKCSGSDLTVDKSGEKIILIHTYVDEPALKKDGTFHDRYFPGLADWLKEKGSTVVMLPVLFNLQRSVVEAWQWFRHSKQHFINPHSYYRLSDYFYALSESWRQKGMPSGKIILCGMDVSVLFHAERDRSAFGCLDAILYYRLPKRLNQAGFHIDRVIMPFENMIDEKLFILGLRHDSKTTKIVSYQHGALYPLLPGNYISKEEMGFSPLPDRVVCNGKFFREILLREGLPSQMLAVGPALRYTSLWEYKKEDHAQKTVDILVPLALMDFDAFELITKVVLAFEDHKNIRVAIKPHPMTSLEALSKRPLIKALPPHIQLVQGEMRDWLSKSRIMVAMSSSSSLEAIAAGVPVVVVGRDGAIDLNSLGFFPEFDQVFSDPKTIREEAKRLLSFSEQELQDYLIRSHEILEICFSPKTEDHMQVFLEEISQ